MSAKLLNDPFRAVDEMLAGVACAHAGRCELLPGGRALVTRERSAARRVAVITGGGSGHEPAFFGFLGPGLADGVAVGNVFASPSARPVAELVRHLQPPDGALFVYGNYEGDVMNFGLAAELLADEGVPSETVLVTDDVASAPRDQRSERRGVAGGLIVLKAAGARADEGAGLAAVAAAARLANERTRTIGIGLAPCTLPTAEAPTFELAEGEMDVGMGVHGEAGIERSALRPADEVADLLLELILADRQPERGEPVHALVNTLGATTMMEGYVLLRRVAAGLAEREIPLRRAVVGEYITSLEMAGLSLTITALNDDLARWLAAPAAPLAGVDPWRYAA